MEIFKMKSVYSYWLYKILLPSLIFFTLVLAFTIYFFFKEIYIYRNNNLHNTAQIVANLSRDAILSGDEFELYKSLSKIVKNSDLLIKVYSTDKKLNINYPPFEVEKENIEDLLQVKIDITGSLGDILGQVIIYEKASSPFEYKFYLLLSMSMIIIFFFLFNNLKIIINDFKKLDNLLNRSSIIDVDTNHIFFHEFKNIFLKVLKLTDSLVIKQKEQAEKNQKILLGVVAKQVAHDIRSPLSVLNMITSSLEEVSEEKKELIKSSIQRINDIANDLLRRGKQTETSNQSSSEINFQDKKILLLNPIIESIVSEKRIQFKNRLKIDIHKSYSNVFNCFCSVNESNLKRILSNLINNSVEAIKENCGTIELALTSNSKDAIIKITDNGPGIPQHVLDKLGYESVSYGKDNTESGSGLGVLHAKQTIESMNGKFSISSTLDKGTEVVISLPLSEKPIWFLEKLFIKETTKILVCDDDSSIIALWKRRFTNFPSSKVNYFTSISTLKDFLQANQDLDFILLIDYEFSGEQKSGLDFIIETRLFSKSILITSHYEEEQIVRTCLEYGIKQIPKNICALVPIEMISSKQKYDAVILDNEDLQIRSWQFAAIQNGKTILAFDNLEKFIAALPNIDHNTPLFIDSILDATIKGEDIAKQVFDQGFKNVYMSSGHDPSYFKDMTFLKGIIGKTPFFP